MNSKVLDKINIAIYDAMMDAATTYDTILIWNPIWNATREATFIATSLVMDEFLNEL